MSSNSNTGTRSQTRWGEPAPSGTGWYRISSPVEGWAQSSFLPDAELNDCTLRNNFAKTGNWSVEFRRAGQTTGVLIRRPEPA